MRRHFVDVEERENGDLHVTVPVRIPDGDRRFRIPDETVLEVRRGKTMRAHCFYCWNDCTRMSSEAEGVRLCEDCAEPGDRPLDDEEMWDRGMRDA